MKLIQLNFQKSLYTSLQHFLVQLLGEKKENLNSYLN